MQLTPSLNIKQRQSLVMTPQLQQAIKLLQMTNLDLSNLLWKELRSIFVDVAIFYLLLEVLG